MNMTSSETFERLLELGRIEEYYVTEWFQDNGLDVLNISEDARPDLEFKDFWLEVKRKDTMVRCHNKRKLDVVNGAEDATGYQMHEYALHLELNRTKPVFVWFMDPSTGIRSGCSLTRLKRYRIRGVYKNIGHGIIVFDVKALLALDSDDQRRWLFGEYLPHAKSLSGFYNAELRS